MLLGPVDACKLLKVGHMSMAVCKFWLHCSIFVPEKLTRA